MPFRDVNRAPLLYSCPLARERFAFLRYDDRLATVLDQPAADPRGRAVQWRQLVELVARGQGEASPELTDRALARIAGLMEELPADILAATARAIAGAAVPAELVALFAARGAAVSAALVTAADLDLAGWRAVRAVAAPDVLPFLGPIADAELIASHTVATAPAPTLPVVPQPAKPAEQAAPLPAGLFRWECGPTGEIDWVEGAPRAALIGWSLTEPFADRFAARLPFSDEALVLSADGELAGEWRWSGTPAFFPDTGRFAGYRGIARRDGAEPAADAAVGQLPEDDDLRELMHELRTPLNAIIGFGEIIEGQYLGPAHRAYRERAGEIVRQARRLADAVDNLDLAARLRSGRAQGETVTGLDRVREVVADLRRQAEERVVFLGVQDRSGVGRLALQPLLAERLIRQFAAAMLEPAVAGERIGLVVDRLGNQLAIGIDRPRALQALSERRMMDDRGQTGMRFSLRLVQGLSAMIGGRLDVGAERLVLLLPFDS